MKTTIHSIFAKCTFLVAIGLVTSNAKAQVDPVLADQLQLTLDTELSNQGTIGISAAVYIPGQGMWTGASGISSIQGVVNPVETDMLFDYGSITKNYTAAVILQLEEEGLLSIDDPIYMHLPDVDYTNIDSTATLKQMMNMTSGIYDYTSNPAFFGSIFSNPSYCWDEDTLIDTFVVNNPQDFPPGTSWSYCNTGFNMLGSVILNITGEPDLETVYNNRFFTPLNLPSQQFGVCDLDTAGFAHPWGDTSVAQNSLIDMSWFSRNALLTGSYSAGAMTGTAEDIALWNKAIFLDKVVLTQSSLDSMLTFIPRPDTSATSAWWNGYGLGTMRMVSCGEEWYGYGGDILGYTTLGMYNPADSVIIAFTMNQDAVGQGRIDMMAALCATVDAHFLLAGQVENEAIQTTMTAYPNPFNESLNIRYTLQQAENVRISVYDLVGNEVAMLSEGNQLAGVHEVNWNGETKQGFAAAGQYFVRIQGENSNVRLRVLKTSR